MDEDLQEVARALLAAGCKELVRKDAPVEPALELMDAALLLSPFLRVYAVSVRARSIDSTAGIWRSKAHGGRACFGTCVKGAVSPSAQPTPRPSLALAPVGQAGIST